MELLVHDAPWFLSKPGLDTFASVRTLEERSIFLYSYLKQIAKPEYEKDQLLFRIAFFFADAIAGSSLPYSAYPALIDPEKNPFVAYLKNADCFPGGKAVYYIFLSILHGTAVPAKQNEWIYDKQLKDPEYLKEKLEDSGKAFFKTGVDMASADSFAIEESLQLVQLKLIWLMGQL